MSTPTKAEVARLLKQFPFDKYTVNIISKGEILPLLGGVTSANWGSGPLPKTPWFCLYQTSSVHFGDKPVKGFALTKDVIEVIDENPGKVDRWYNEQVEHFRKKLAELPAEEAL
jgi:hypothetical protein